MKKTLLVTFGAILLLPLGLMAQEDGTDEAPGPLSELRRLRSWLKRKLDHRVTGRHSGQSLATT